MIQNCHFVSKSTAERNDNFVRSNILQIALFCHRHGVSGFLLELGQALRSLQAYIDDDEEAEGRRQHRNFNYRKKLCECSPNGEISGLSHVLVSADGTLDFSDLAMIFDFLSSHSAG